MGDARTALPDLTAIRNHRGISLREIADETRIRIGYLEAIEHGDFDKLPGRIYTRSYIRQYARLIDFDQNEILRALPPDPEQEPPIRPGWVQTLKSRVARFMLPVPAGRAAESRRAN